MGVNKNTDISEYAILAKTSVKKYGEHIYTKLDIKAEFLFLKIL